MFKKLPLDDNGDLVSSELSLESPRNLVIVSFPKMGKTYNMVNVPNFLIGDAESGAAYFKAKNRVNLLSYNDKEFVKIGSGAYIPGGIYETVDELNAVNKMSEYWSLYARMEKENSAKEKKVLYSELIAHLQGMKFPVFVIDTITSMQELNNAAALAEYNDSHPGQKVLKTHIKRVDEFGGVQHIRRNFAGLKSFIENNAAPFIIWNGHVAEKRRTIKKGESDISAVDIALDGILSYTFTARADSVCVMYRNEEGCFLDFTKKDESDLGSRPQHVSNKVIKIADLNKVDANGVVLEKGKTYWNKIYPELIF